MRWRIVSGDSLLLASSNSVKLCQIKQYGFGPRGAFSIHCQGGVFEPVARRRGGAIPSVDKGHGAAELSTAQHRIRKPRPGSSQAPHYLPGELHYLTLLVQLRI